MGDYLVYRVYSDAETGIQHTLPALGQTLIPHVTVSFLEVSSPEAILGCNQQNSLHRKDESKEPIVEVRTEEERTPNHDGGKHTEPNETTPLTEPEYVD